ncbi:hypothetical protein DRJ22_00510 [Candidatus Woesearchaeota archaeon]|nr:MAG: hypothetical protein B6U93_00165 [Candidatus Woesearchaeota archaeon ex4484_78]RLE46974.1 MAG: hypothetical protein DRJ22_00510 [Candidatus Woesearchaeota archaeon]
MEDKLLALLVEQNEISWKSIIYDLIRTEQMDPWDINISLIAQKYIERIKRLKEADLKIGGKVLLAAAILLRIKSNKLMGDDLNEFDRLLAGPDMNEEAFYDELEQELTLKEDKPTEKMELQPRLPQPRRRKVSVYDLVRALEKALEVKKRRVLNKRTPHMEIPQKKFDIEKAIKNLYNRIISFLTSAKRITFKKLLKSNEKKEKVYTFIPLLYLSNQNKIKIQQEKPFGEIHITARGGINADKR